MPAAVCSQAVVACLSVAQPASSGISAFQPYLPLAMTVLGWMVVSWDHDRRQRRKDVRDRIGIVQELVAKIIDLATRHYVSDPDSTESAKTARDVKFELRRLGHEVQMCYQLSGSRCDAGSELVNFRKLLTGRDFESKGRVQRLDADPLFESMQAAGFALVSALDRGLELPAWRFGWRDLLRKS